MPQTCQSILRCVLGWSRGVTVSTLDSDSSDRGSNPRETCEQPLDLIAHPCPAGWLLVMAVLLWWGSCRQLQAPSTANVGGDLRCSYARPDYMPQTWQAILRCVLGWSRGVTVSTLDSESSARGSNPRGTSCSLAQACDQRPDACVVGSRLDGAA